MQKPERQPGDRPARRQGWRAGARARNRGTRGTAAWQPRPTPAAPTDHTPPPAPPRQQQPTQQPAPRPAQPPPTQPPPPAQQPPSAQPPAQPPPPPQQPPARQQQPRQPWQRRPADPGGPRQRGAGPYPARPADATTPAGQPAAPTGRTGTPRPAPGQATTPHAAGLGYGPTDTFEPAPEPPGQPGQQRPPGQQNQASQPNQPGQASQDEDAGPTVPSKITVTRVAAWRARQGVHLFRKATRADGAGESGLTSLTYAVMFNYASDAVLAVALANTLFFSAATAESKSKVFLYLLITVAPFALVAPVIGPLLDRIHYGRRLALAATCVGQAILAVVLALNFDSWALYPCALGMMVLSKSFTVLKAAVTPRVLPPTITLVKTNARLTVFGLVATAVFGAIGAGIADLSGSPGALVLTAAINVAGAVLSMRIPSWVEDTKGEVPASLTATQPINRKRRRQPMGRNVVIALWANGTIRLLTGFLTLFAAFVIKAETEHDPVRQLLLLGSIGVAAGAGSFIGNMVGARLSIGKPDQMVLTCIGATLASTIVAAVLAGVPTAAGVGLVGSVASALVKIALDAVIQSDLPDRSRASAFGFSETVVQLAWVFGGAIGVLLPARFWIGFTVASCLVALGLVQVLLTRAGRSLIPGFGGNRPLRPAPVDDTPLPDKAPKPRTPTRTLPTRRL